MMTVMVETKNLTKDYGTVRAVNDVSFTVSGGEVVGFLGPNGAGKSTTMKMLTGFLRPTLGTASIGGVRVDEAPLEAQAKIGYLPESAPLYEDMMVADFLRYVSDVRGVRDADRKARLPGIAERCGIMNVLGKDIGQLSKGFRQRVGLAQALVHDPDLLILDEPTSGLDPNQIVEIRELIREIGREKTVLLSTHILPEVQATCSRILIISDGKLVADDTPDHLTEKDAGVSVIEVVVKGNNGTAVSAEQLQSIFSNLPGIKNVDPGRPEGSETHGFRLSTEADQDPREQIFRAAVSNDFVLLGMHRERISLEDTFRRLTRGEGGDRPNA